MISFEISKGILSFVESIRLDSRSMQSGLIYANLHILNPHSFYLCGFLVFTIGKVLERFHPCCWHRDAANERLRVSLRRLGMIWTRGLAFVGQPLEVFLSQLYRYDEKSVRCPTPDNTVQPTSTQVNACRCNKRILR
jgi:hypothetical protein